jgi:Zn finger protein HypA/HybF involved in hydrogenase expression
MPDMKCSNCGEEIFNINNRYTDENNNIFCEKCYFEDTEITHQKLERIIKGIGGVSESLSEIVEAINKLK